MKAFIAGLILLLASAASAVELGVSITYQFTAPVGKTVMAWELSADGTVASTWAAGQTVWSGTLDLPEGDREFRLRARYDDDTYSLTSLPYRFTWSANRPVIQIMIFTNQ